MLQANVGGMRGGVQAARTSGWTTCEDVPLIRVGAHKSHMSVEERQASWARACHLTVDKMDAGPDMKKNSEKSERANLRIVHFFFVCVRTWHGAY